MTADEFRKLALDIPVAVERSHMHHPDFRVAGKIFASLGVPNKDWGMVKLTPEQQRTFIEKAPEIFKPASGAWGRQGYTNVYLPAAKATMVRAALDAAAKNVGSKKKQKTPHVGDDPVAGVCDHRTLLSGAIFQRKDLTHIRPRFRSFYKPSAHRVFANVRPLL
jgi:YjbR